MSTKPPVECQYSSGSIDNSSRGLIHAESRATKFDFASIMIDGLLE